MCASFFFTRLFFKGKDLLLLISIAYWSMPGTKHVFNKNRGALLVKPGMGLLVQIQSLSLINSTVDRVFNSLFDLAPCLTFLILKMETMTVPFL